MKPDDSWTTERVWDELASRFGSERVSRYRRTSTDEGAFDAVRDDLQREVARMSGEAGDINRADAKAEVVFAHVLLAVLDGVRRGRTAWRPMPRPRSGRAAEETALLLWASEHGISDIRESRVQEREPGSAM